MSTQPITPRLAERLNRRLLAASQLQRPRLPRGRTGTRLRTRHRERHIQRPDPPRLAEQPPEQALQAGHADPLNQVLLVRRCRVRCFFISDQSLVHLLVVNHEVFLQLYRPLIRDCANLSLQLGNILRETLTFWTEAASWDRRSRSRGGQWARSRTTSPRVKHNNKERFSLFSYTHILML